MGGGGFQRLRKIEKDSIIITETGRLSCRFWGAVLSPVEAADCGDSSAEFSYPGASSR